MDRKTVLLIEDDRNTKEFITNSYGLTQYKQRSKTLEKHLCCSTCYTK